MADGRDEGVVTRFYNESRTEIFDLAHWHSRDPIHFRVLMCADIAYDRGCRDYLDYGSGIGSDALVWGVTTPLLAVAGLTTKLVPRWICWVGLVAAVFAGWLGLFSPISSLADGVSTIGFFAFFIFFAALGVALLRREPIS